MHAHPLQPPQADAPPHQPLYWAVVTRAILLALAIVFVFGFAALTIDAFAEQGVTLPGVVSLFVLVLLGVGVLGALFGKPPRGPRP